MPLKDSVYKRWDNKLFEFIVVMCCSISLLVVYEINWIWIVGLSIGKVVWYFIEYDDKYKLYGRASVKLQHVQDLLYTKCSTRKYGKYLISNAASTQRDHHLDTMRGVASISVMFYHLIHPDYMFVELIDILTTNHGFDSFSASFGNLMVPVFVVLSGFVLSKVYWVTKLRSLKQMILGRFSRFYPLHWATESIHLPVSSYMTYHYLRGGIPYINSGLFFSCLSLTHMWSYSPNTNGAFNYRDVCNGPAWSLSIELGVNLLFFLSISFFPNYFSIFLFENLAYLGYYGTTAEPSFGRSGNAALMFAFFLGVILGKFTNWIRIRFVPLQVAADIYLLTLLWNYKAWISLDADGNRMSETINQTIFSEYWISVYTSVVIFVVNQSLIIKKLASLSIFTFFGTISFSLYLVHYPLLMILHLMILEGKATKLQTYWDFYSFSVLLVAISAFVHYKFEKPSKEILDPLLGISKRKKVKTDETLTNSIHKSVDIENK